MVCGSPAPPDGGLGRGEEMGRGLTYPNRRVQVGHSHLLRTLHGLDHLLLVLRARGASAPGHVPAAGRAPAASSCQGTVQSPPSPAQSAGAGVLSRGAPRALKELYVPSRGPGGSPTS